MSQNMISVNNTEFDFLSFFNGQSTFVGYLKPKQSF